jgi:hypothetical protein
MVALDKAADKGENQVCGPECVIKSTDSTAATATLPLPLLLLLEQKSTPRILTISSFQ